MKLSMIGIDFHTAKIEVREEFSLTEDNIKTIYKNIKENEHVDGLVILTTCNRTEFYLSSNDYLDKNQLISMFSKATQIKEVELDEYCYIKREDDLIYYLFELACGLHSMILGEDQIITQVNDAMDLAISEKSSNSILNTLFRYAVTCAKKAKFQVNINFVSPSIVSSTINLAGKHINLNDHIKVLVIGNGEIGRLAAASFIEKGCNVTMTKRNYKYSEVIIPDGCKTIPYGERFSMIPKVDIVVSATKSPHYTVTFEMMKNLTRTPEYIFDLAMPRDIEPEIKNINGIKCFDVDDIGKSDTYFDLDKIQEIKEIIRKYYNKYDKWYLIRQRLETRGAKNVR